MRFHPVEIVAEAVHPKSPHRPEWHELIKRIRNNEITLIILPSLFHVAGHDIAQLSDFLALLEMNDVKLLTLKERINTDRLSRSQTLIQFVTRTLSLTPNKGIS